MKAVLYGVRPGASWRWCVSVAVQADAAWWMGRGVKRIWVMDRERLSLGQAFERREGLQLSRVNGPVEGKGNWVECARLGETFLWDKRGYETFASAIEGRCLLREEVESYLSFLGLRLNENRWLSHVQWGALEGRIRLHHGVTRTGRRGLWSRWRPSSRTYRCVRCGSGEKEMHRTPCPHCGEDCPYCEACLTMGRVRFCSLLVQGIVGAANVPEAKADTLNPNPQWGLSPAQQTAVEEALRFMDDELQRKFLLWAVTGAGKTEMIFPLVERALSLGGRALIATPRKDVVLELAPRLKAAFPDRSIVTLYGGSEERWASGQLTLATTHQLFRFREAFDLVVLDEIDAFPYHGDPQLEYAAEKSCRADGGKFVLLSATPPLPMRKLAVRGLLPHAKVCVRFHRYPLPVPRRIAAPPLNRWSARGVPLRLRKALEHSLARGAVCFAFVPAIEVVEPLVRLLRAAFPGVAIDGTSSKDEERASKVMLFRQRALQIIVTTTILERGVTVPKSDVYILDADCPLFDDAALVQMAGRAGRKLEDPVGNVYFCAPDWTRAQRTAVREIQTMNELARKKGFLIS